jgi:hypothetical protein
MEFEDMISSQKVDIVVLWGLKGGHSVMP